MINHAMSDVRLIGIAGHLKIKQFRDHYGGYKPRITILVL